MNLNHTRVLLAGIVLASAIGAQTKTANYVRTWGPTDPAANLNIDLQATVTKGIETLNIKTTSIEKPYARAHAHARATVNILSWSAKALAIEANSYSGFRGDTGSLKCVVAGFTVLNETHSGTYTWSHQFGPYNLFASDPEIPVPFTAGLVTLGVNIGGGAELTLVTSGNFTAPSLSLGGTGRVYGTGRTRVVAGILGFGVGLSADLRFLDTSASPYLSASPTTLTGALNLTMTPIAIVLKAFLTLPKIGAIASATIWSYSAAPRTASIVGS